jgi:hypothetical protein
MKGEVLANAPCGAAEKQAIFFDMMTYYISELSINLHGIFRYNYELLIILLI